MPTPSITDLRGIPDLRVLDLLRPRWPRLLAAIALGTGALSSALALAGISAWLITRAWEMPPVLALSVAVVLVRLFGISRAVLGYCERLASHDVALRSAGNTRTELYRRLSAAPPSTVLRLSSGELVARAGASVDELADVLARAVLPIAVAAVLSVSAVTVVGVLCPTAGAALAGALLIAGIWAPWQAARAARAAEQIAAAHHSDRDRAVMLALQYGPELRVGGKLAAVIADADREQRRSGAAADRAARPAAVAAAIPVLATGFSTLGAVLTAITLVPHLSPTSLAVLMLLPLSSFEAVVALPAAAIQLTRARIALRQLTDLLTDAPSGRQAPAATPLTVRAGDRVAVLGASGAGKTTLLLATAEHCHEKGITAGFFAEDAHLFDTTLRDNLLVARGDADDDELAAALERVGLGPWLRSLPEGLNTMLDCGAAAVSAGQRRRLLLARALLTAFSVVLLDEPTEHLDAADAHRLLGEMLTPGAMFAADRTVVVATHQLPAGINCRTHHVNSAGVDNGYPAHI